MPRSSEGKKTATEPPPPLPPRLVNDCLDCRLRRTDPWHPCGFGDVLQLTLELHCVHRQPMSQPRALLPRPRREGR